MIFDNEFMTLCMKVDDKLFEVTAICTNVAEANAYLESKAGEAVIACDGKGGIYTGKVAAIGESVKAVKAEPLCALIGDSVVVIDNEAGTLTQVHALPDHIHEFGGGSSSSSIGIS